ncbi:hypothetical protein [Nocardioides bigeumensis]
MTHPPSEHEPPIEVEGLEDTAEDLDAADVADRVDDDPEEQPNRVDPEYAQDEGDPV